MITDVPKIKRTEIPSSSQDKTKPVKKIKWRRAGDEMLSFGYALPSRVYTIPLSDTIFQDDIEEELKAFEKELEEINTEVKPHYNEDALQKDDRVVILSRGHSISETFHFNDIIEEMDYYSDACYCGDLDYEEKVPIGTLAFLENFAGCHPKMHLRNKGKWRHTKAHKAIKTKHCSGKNIRNRPHGTKLYIHQRLQKLIQGDFSNCNYLPTPKHLTRAYIDAKGRHVKGASKCAQKYAGKVYAPYNAPYYAPVANRGRDYPIAQPVPRYALNANNADQALERDLVNILINLQNRDLTPEDYELLLQLDERVAPKTVTTDILASFKTEQVGEEHTCETCAICMEQYQLLQTRKFLPCGHVFHDTCIDSWLGNSSLNCPLDGLSVEPDH